MTRHHCVTKMWMIVAGSCASVCQKMFSALVDREFVYRITSYTVLQHIVHSLTLCYTILHYFTWWYTIVHYVTLLYTIIHYYKLLYTIVHCDFSHCRRETSVWMMFKLMDFIAESGKEKLTRKLLIPCLVKKNLLCFTIYKKPTQERRNRRESFWESFSSFSAITRKYGVVQSHFWYASLPPPFPPFPPQSNVFQPSRVAPAGRALRAQWKKKNLGNKGWVKRGRQTGTLQRGRSLG